ncbi:MAG: DUF1349 domain-containing protein, partial [Bacteroidetes bacterium]|nr:DUF1349 domain-containing protein [Bacteroidota bacterium]
AAPAGAGLVSDDFSGASLDLNLWSIIDPVGDAAVSLDGERLVVDLPAGSEYDAWTRGNTALRVVQQVDDADFEVEVKFESAVSEKYQDRGVYVGAVSGQFLRFDVYWAGNTAKAFAAMIDGSAASTKVNTAIPASVPLWLQVQRDGDVWTYRYSLDGASWTQVVQFIEPVTVSSVGLYAGNPGSPVPAHTALADYFFDTANPIIPEDGGSTQPSLAARLADATSSATSLQDFTPTASGALDGAVPVLTWSTGAPLTPTTHFEVQHARPVGMLTTIAHLRSDTLAALRDGATFVYRHEAVAGGAHRYRIVRVEQDGQHFPSEEVSVDVPLATDFLLTPPYPNPFAATARFSVTVAVPQRVQVLVYDMLGRQVARLHDGPLPEQVPTEFEVEADGLASGVYIIRVLGEHFAGLRQVVLVR